MASLYLSDEEVSAINAIDHHEVDRCIKQELDERRAGALSDLHLSAAHPSIAHHLHRFRRDLQHYALAKAAAKRDRTWSHAWRSGDDLKHTIIMLKQRLEEQEAERQLVVIDDHIYQPYRFSDRLEVQIHYRWRATPETSWDSGAVTFFHDVDMRPDYADPQPARKLSSAKLDAKRQDDLFDRWEQLRILALHAVREYLTTGGDGSAIPKRVEAKPSGHGRFLDNFSCNFWEALGEPRDRPRRASLASEVQIPRSPSQPATSDGSVGLHGRVRHKVFGEGVVIHIEGDKVVAEFGDRGPKRVMANFLEPVDTNASEHD